MKPQPQVRDTAILKKTYSGSRILWWVKLIIFVASAIWISKLASSRVPDFISIRDGLARGGSSLFLVALVLLLPLNIYLETIKWITLLKRKVGNWSSFKSVLAGITLGLITPAGVGDALGRMTYLKNVSPITSLPAVILNSLIQTMITMTFGIVGLYAMVQADLLDSGFVWMSLVGVLALLGIGVLMFSGIGPIFKVRSILRLCGKYPISTIWQASLIGIMRYLVFSTQYALAIYAFGIDLGVAQVFIGITWVFLAKTLVPTFSRLGDLGVRELSALVYFQALGVEPAIIVLASLTVWVVNNLLPSLIGVPALVPANSKLSG